MSRTLFSAYDAAQGTGHGSELWITDGTAAGTSMVIDINPSGDSTPSGFAALGTSAVFTAFDGTHGSELWITDGTSAGTSLVKDINPSASSQPKYLTTLGSRVLFVADDGTHGLEMWVTDGSSAGTYLLKDINPGSAAASNRADHFSMIVNGNNALFWADDGVHGRELWITDGTSAGTTFLKDINPGGGSSKTYFPGGVTLNGKSFFRADDGTHNEELWVTDGTAAGTSMIKDIRTGNLGGYPKYFTPLGANVVFTARDATHGYELWTTDGTDAGTTMLADINPGTNPSVPRELTRIGSALLFNANDGSHGNELWVTDGTSGGTSLLADIHAGAPQSAPARLTVLGSQVIFNAGDGVHGYEAWVSDGTSAGTSLLQDVRAGSSGSYPSSIHAGGTGVVFNANDGVHGGELWTTDGTTAGTSLVADINPGVNGGGELNFFVLSDALPCFRRGTSIRTETGEANVESLRIGDRVPTLFNGFARVVWIGHRHIDCVRHPRPEDVLPIRIRQDAFGPDMPSRDLFLSPDHAVFVEDVLIPVRHLVNGTTVTREQASTVTYFHVELEQHDVLWSEGLTTESFLDTGNRANFSNAGSLIKLHPDFSLRVWEAEGCAPLVVTGRQVDAVRSLLATRAPGLGLGRQGRFVDQDSGVLFPDLQTQ